MTTNIQIIGSAQIVDNSITSQQVDSSILTTSSEYHALPADVASAGATGSSALYSPGDHAHKGVHSVSASGSSQLFGDIQFLGASGTVVSQSGQIIYIAGGVGSGGGVSLYPNNPAEIASSAAVGVSSQASPGDHVHRGLHSLQASGSVAIYGDAFLTVGQGLVLSETSPVISISSTVTGSYNAYNLTPADVASSGAAGVVSEYARGDHAHKGLHSINATGSSQLFGDVNLVAGAGIALTEAGQMISIRSTVTGSYGVYPSLPADVAATAVVGSSLLYSAGDHAHKGLHSLAATGSSQLFGDAVLIGGAGISLVEAGQAISIVSTVTGSYNASTILPLDVASAAVIGTSTNYTREDHVHKGLHSINATGSAQMFGDVNLVAGLGIALTEAGQMISIRSTVTGSYGVYPSLPADVASAAVVGSSLLYAAGDHAHRGVLSINVTGSAALYGAVLFSPGAGISIAQSGQQVSITTSVTGSMFIHTHSDNTSGGATIDANMFTRSAVTASGTWTFSGGAATDRIKSVAITGQTGDLFRADGIANGKTYSSGRQFHIEPDGSIVYNNLGLRFVSSPLEITWYQYSDFGADMTLGSFLQYTNSAQSGNIYGLRADTSANHSTGLINGMAAMSFQAAVSPTGNGRVGSVQGFAGLVYIGSSSSMALDIASAGQIQINQGNYSVVNHAYELNVGGGYLVSGTWVEHMGVFINDPDIQGGTITTNYGIKIDDSIGKGATNYGLYIGITSGSTSGWNIYTNGGRHSFKDEVVIGQPSSYDTAQALYVYGNMMAVGNSANTVGQIYTALDSIGTTDFVLKRANIAYQSVIHFYTAGNEYAQMGNAAGTGTFIWNTTRTDSSFVIQTLGVNRIIVDPLVGTYHPNNVGNSVAYFGNSGTIALGNNLGPTFASASGTSLYLSASGTYNGEALIAGDLIIGENSANKANLRFSRATDRIEIRGNKTVMSYIDTDGTLTAGGGKVLINTSGITVKGAANSETWLSWQTSASSLVASFNGYDNGSDSRNLDIVVRQGTGTNSPVQVNWSIFNNSGGSAVNRMFFYGPDQNASVGSKLGALVITTVNTEFRRTEPYGDKFTQVASVTGTPPLKLVELIGAAHVNIPITTENNDILINLARTVKWAGNGGTVATQRAMLIQAPTYAAAAGASGIFTNAATLAISGAPATDGTAIFTNVPSALWVQSGKTQIDGIINLGANTAPLTRVVGTIRRDSTIPHYLYFDDSVKERSIPSVGWMPYAYPIGGSPTQTTTTARNLASGTAIAIPIVLEGHMLAQSITIWNTDTTTARAGEFALYEDRLDNANAINRIAGSTGTFAFTPGAAAVQNGTISSAPLYLAPGVYWIVIRPTNGGGFGIGETPAGTMAAVNTMQTKPLGAVLGATLDMVAATWTKVGAVAGLRLNGRVFGDSVKF